MMVKPKKTSATRYRREEKQTRASEFVSHNSVPTPRRRSTLEELRISKAANQDLTDENNKIQSELAERRIINDELMTSMKSHETKITELNKTAEHLQEKLDEAKNNNTMMSELLKINMDMLSRSSNDNKKLISLVDLLRKRLRYFKRQKETSEKLLQGIRQKCKHIFNSQFHPDFVQANSNLITSVVELYESHSHSDRIKFCPAIQYMKTVPKDITSSGTIKNVACDSATPSKKMKIDNSTHDIEKNYSHTSLKALVMNLEKRHSDNYQLWCNVLWSLHKYGSEQGYDTLEIANRFSQRSKKYTNLEDVRKTFESSNGTLSLHYLIEISKIYEEDLDALSDYLSRKVPVAYLPFVIRQMDVRDRRKFRLIVDCAEKSQTLFIIPEQFVLTDEGDKRLCFLSSSVSSKTSELALLCPYMKDGYTGKFNANKYVFRARSKPSATVELYEPFNPAESYIILPNGRQDKKGRHLAKIRMLLRTKAIHLLRLKTKKKIDDEEDDSNIVVELYESHSHRDRINFCPAIQYIKTVPKDITSSEFIKNVESDSATLPKRRKINRLKTKKMFGDEEDDSNIVVIPDEEPDGIRSDEELVEALFNANPSMKSRYCYSEKTIYYCSPITNLWSNLSDTEFELHLQENLTTTLRLNKAELKHIGMTNTIVKVRNIILGKIENNDLFSSHDSNWDLFVTLNKAVDMTQAPPVIRNIEKDDMAETTCGWSYNRQLSEKHKEAVQSYFDKVFPKKSERKWFLRFIASLLNGRGSSVFLVLTYNQENENVKSNVISLLATVFGNYYTADNKIVVSGGGRDQNPFDAGLCNLYEKRFLVADKLQRADTLNSAFIKALTNKHYYFVQDTNKFSGTQCIYPLVAGLIMTFTKDDVPQFDKKDQDFVERMVAIPMRSQFISKNEYDELVKKGEDMTDIYIADDTPNFQEWSSAVLDLLIENYGKKLLEIPYSMVNSRYELIDTDYYKWLVSNLCADEGKQAFVSATQIMSKITKTQELNPGEMNRLRRDMSRWAKENDFQYIAWHVSNERKQTKAEPVIMGVSFILT